MAYANPLKKLHVTSGYRTARRPSHSATDYRASIGTTLYAAIDGTVKTGSGHSRAGNWVEIHGDGEMAGYSHLSHRHVRPGQRVSAGDVIGNTGNTGNVTGPHLHFYVKLNGRYTNPHKWLGRKIKAQETVKQQRKSGGKTTEDWLSKAEIKRLQSGLRRIFPAYRWRVNVRRGRLIAVDGIDGPQTQAWVKAFQKAVSIKVDGIVGPVTKGKLANYGVKI